MGVLNSLFQIALYLPAPAQTQPTSKPSQLIPDPGTVAIFRQIQEISWYLPRNRVVPEIIKSWYRLLVGLGGVGAYMAAVLEATKVSPPQRRRLEWRRLHAGAKIAATMKRSLLTRTSEGSLEDRSLSCL